MSERTRTDRGAKEIELRALARRLKEAREYLGLSQEAVGHSLDIPRASVSAIESGKRKVSSSELRRLAELYRVSVAELLGERDEPDPVRKALYRATQDLSDEDRQQVLRFASFLRNASRTQEDG